MLARFESLPENGTKSFTFYRFSCSSHTFLSPIKLCFFQASPVNLTHSCTSCNQNQFLDSYTIYLYFDFYAKRESILGYVFYDSGDDKTHTVQGCFK